LARAAPDSVSYREDSGIRLEPVTRAQGPLARGACHRFGKGTHPVSLDFGDCFAYALAKQRDLALPFKDEDFAKTDVRPAP
jgi:ribonuclease VapC